MKLRCIFATYPCFRKIAICYFCVLFYRNFQLSKNSLFLLSKRVFKFLCALSRASDFRSTFDILLLLFLHRNTLPNTPLVSFTLQILDVERMLAKSSMDMTAKGMEHGHPVIRTLYDHMEVRCFLIIILCRT